MTGRIREIIFDEGVDATGTVIEVATQAYVDAKFDPLTSNSKGIYLNNTSGLPTLSPWRSGVLAWDKDENCLAVSTAYDGSWLQVGSEEQESVRNKTGALQANGKVVYIQGATGHIPEFQLATCADEAIAKRTIGIITATAGIGINDVGPICLSGHVHGLNTNSFTVGDILWLDTTAGSYTATRPSYQYEQIMVGIVLEKSPTDGVIYVEVRDLTDQIAKAGFHIVDPHGFTEYDNTYMTRSWVGNTFTLTQVGASTPYYCKGKLKYLTGNKSINLTPTAGAHFIGLNCTTEVLEDLGGTIPTASVVSTHILCEFAYANGTNVIFNSNERHSTKFPKRIWFYNHLYLSTQYRSGITPSITSINGNGSSITHAQFSSTTGLIADEDIEITIAALAAGDSKNLWYYNGTVWVVAAQSSGAGVLTAGTGRAAYNNIASGLAECTNNYHVLTHLFAVNNGTVIGIVGNSQYQLLNDAKLAASTEIGTLITTGLPFPEFRAIATFINKTSDTYSNAVKTAILSVDTGVPYIDWRKTALNPAAGSNAANHNQLSSLQGGQAGEYYHLTAAQQGNIVSNIFPAGSGAATNLINKVYLPTATSAEWAALTPTERLIGWDSTKKKPVVGDGTAFKQIGGGLIATPINKDSSSTLESGKHYLYDGSGMTGGVNKTLNLPAITAEANIKITVYNIPVGYKVIVAPNGAEKIFFNDTDQSTVEFIATETEQWAEFISNNVKWIVNDAVGGIGYTLSGPLTVTGPFTPSGGIVGKTDGVAVAAGYVGEFIPFANLSTTSTLTDGAGELEIGNGTTRLTLTKGNYFVTFSGDGTMSDTTIRVILNIAPVSGTIVQYRMGNFDSILQTDSTLPGTVVQMNGMAYVRVTSDCVLRVMGNSGGGNITNARLSGGGAIRIA